jgi:hypothetical protein
MSAYGLISGRLHGEPTTRPTRNGGVVTFFKLKVSNGSSAIEWWEVAAFSEKAREKLEGLSDGDVVSAVGVVHAELFEFRGEQRIKRTLTADRVLALKPAARLPGEIRPRTGREVAEASWAAPQRRGGGGAHDDLI